MLHYLLPKQNLVFRAHREKGDKGTEVVIDMSYF